MTIFDLSVSQICMLVDEWVVGNHAERNRSILKRRFCDGITLEELAEEFNLSVNQIKNVIYINKDKLQHHIGQFTE